MTAKLKKMGYILCIGAFLVFLGSIGIFHSGSGIADFWKTMLILVLAIFLGILSIVCNKSFGLEKFDDFVLGISFATLVNAFVSIGEYELFGEWYSFSGEGSLIFLASIFVLIGILSILMHVKNKVFAFIEIAIICLIISSFLIIYHITDSAGISMIVANLVLFGANIFSLTKKGYSVFTVFTYLSFIFNIMIIGAECIYSSLIFNVITLASIIILLKKYEGTYTDIATLIFSVINMIVLAPAVGAINLGMDTTLLLYVVVVALFDLIVTGLKVIDLKANKILHKVLINIVYFVAFIVSCGFDFVLILVPAIILVVSLLETYVLNDDIEKYLLVYKVFGFVLWVVTYVMDYIDLDSYFVGYCVLNVVTLVAYAFAKERYLKINSLVLLSLTLLFMLCSGTISIIAFIIGLMVIAVDYAVIFMNDKKEDNKLARIFFVVALFFSLILVAKTNIDNFKYLIAAVFYFVLYVLSGKDKLRAGFSVGFIIGSLLLYTYSIQGSPLMLKNLVLFGGIFGFAYTIMDNEKSRATFLNVSTSILIILGICLTIIPENIYAANYSLNMPLIVVLLLESVGLLLYSIMNNNKYLFYSSLVYTVITIIELLFSIDGIPTAVVITLSGIIVISVVLVMIKKYMTDEHEKDLQAEKEHKEFLANSTFCGTCGNRVAKDAVYCGRCGKLIKVETHFCGQCGTEISDSDKKCPKCGDKINK